ncbi:MAG: hypothetical protein U9O56_00305 [Campylobacterota bacterium]|nr:hypothetical protein [Campylobacterota bacterium]
MYWYIFRSYYFALKIILVILNKSTQYISFVSITLFITFFLIIKQGLFIYEDIFINSLKGLYPEFITSSTKISKELSAKYKDKITIKNEVFVHSEEVEFSYDGDKDITKFMNVRTYDDNYKEDLFSTLKISQECKESKQTVWLSSRLYNNFVQDTNFDKKTIYFKNEDDEYNPYPICVFELDNNEKWLLVSNEGSVDIAYLPFAKKVIYTDDKLIKENLYGSHSIDNWKKYIDYDDLGVFLLAKEVSSTFLTTFFIFLLTFMIIAFSSLAKEFEASIFLTKLYGLNIYRTIVLYTFFFILYTIAISFVVLLEYNLISYLIQVITDFNLMLDFSLFSNILYLLILIGFIVSVLISIKYHRLPL